VAKKVRLANGLNSKSKRNAARKDFQSILKGEFTFIDLNRPMAGGEVTRRVPL
jgi:hypothetical protein